MKKSVKAVLFFAFSPKEFYENAALTVVYFTVPLFPLFFPHGPKLMLVVKKRGESVSCVLPFDLMFDLISWPSHVVAK